MVFRGLEGAQRRKKWKVPACSAVLSAKERQVEPCVVGGDRRAAEPGVQLDDDLGEQWRGGDVAVGDAVDVSRPNWPLGVNAGGPLVENAAPRVGGDDGNLDNTMLVGREASGLDVDHREMWLAGHVLGGTSLRR